MDLALNNLQRLICHKTNKPNQINAKHRRDSVVSGTNGLLISDFGSSTRGKTHDSHYANHPQCTAHLVMFKISVGRNP